MSQRSSLVAALVLYLLNTVGGVSLFGQELFLPYHSYSDLTCGSPQTGGYGPACFQNPSYLSCANLPDFLIGLTTQTDEPVSVADVGFFFTMPHFGFSITALSPGGDPLLYYRTAASLGNRSVSLGLGMGWNSRSTGLFDPQNQILLGAFFRPIPYISMAASGITAWSGQDWEIAVDLGLRPFGNNLLELSTDYALQRGEELLNGALRIGVTSEPLDGLSVGVHFSPRDLELSFGLKVSFGHAAAFSGVSLAVAENSIRTSHGIRAGFREGSVIADLAERQDSYIYLDLEGDLPYRAQDLLQESRTLSGVMATLERVKVDPYLCGIAINTSGMAINRSLLWEIRQKLREVKAAGKKVVIFIDQAGMDSYHFASVADRIIMDPLGSLELKGYVMGKTFFKGTLEKYGIGFEEWRLFEYKATVENLSRTKMSVPDRSQLQVLIDDLYSLVKRDVCAERGFTDLYFDGLVNDTGFFGPEEALASNLVDALGRWENWAETADSFDSEERRFFKPAIPWQQNEPWQRSWSDDPRIAVIYAEGVCDMDTGIKARTLGTLINRVAADPCIEAIVLKVDSPGGLPVAADIVAEAIKSAPKPVIVSQGSMAASGGYALSVHGDAILTTPSTITGSIGVIGGWVYNKGLKESFGITTERVATGPHADARFGFSLPYIGTVLPDRNLTAEERKVINQYILFLYRDFVAEVAEGRNMTGDEVEDLARGRIWSGSRAAENGLVDELGGLTDAIHLAAERAGLPADRSIKLVEYPEPPLFSISLLAKLGLLDPDGIGFDGASGLNDSTKSGGFAGLSALGGLNGWTRCSSASAQELLKLQEYLRLWLAENGKPLMILPIDEMGLAGNH